jgi:hypothetical protein
MRGAILGLVAVLATAAVYTQLGALGLGLAPTAALLLLAVPAFAAGAVALRGAAQGGARYPLGLAGPALAYYVAFFGVPLAFLVLFAFATPVGFGEVQYGFDLGNFDVALGGVYVDAFLRTLRFAAIGTLLTVLVGCPLAYWLARYVPDERKGLMLALVIVPFWTSFLIRTSSFLIAFSDDFPLARGLRASGSRRDGSASCTRTPPCRSASSTTTCRSSCCPPTRRWSGSTGGSSTPPGTSAPRRGRPSARSPRRSRRPGSSRAPARLHPDDGRVHHPHRPGRRAGST